jgi:hypothetical protein
VALPGLHVKVTLEDVKVEPGGGLSITTPAGVGVGVAVGVAVGVTVGLGVGVGVGLVEEMAPTSLCPSVVSVTLTLIGDEAAEM